ncbi:hypothetical protein DL98DRAFT_54784 [Cadophora sp. DSE1049]|nr:hypothetical protein DL98DRAFT_54784 [Cadophora sp. DSE1049]
MAAAELLTFDPDGDLLLRLPYFAEQVEGEKRECGTDTETLLDDAAADRLDGAMTPEEEFDELMEEAGTASEIHMLVSSKHLMLASPVFRAMLQYSNFKEGDELRKNGRVEVALPDDNYIAFGIMMDIIHGRVSKIPRRVSLEILTNMSILVDKYETVELFGLILNVWIPFLEKSLPQSFNSDVLPWLSIAWVFRLPEHFRKMTGLLQSVADGTKQEILADTLPIPSRVFEKIEMWRQGTILKALEPIEKFFSDCQSPKGVCLGSARSELIVACNGMMFGTFLRSASAQKIWPLPSYPFHGLRVLEVTKRIRSLGIKSICSNTFQEHKVSYITHLVDTSKSHGYNELFVDKMAKIEGTLSGLGLESFLSQSKHPEVQPA